MGKNIEKIGKKASKKENGENDYLKEYDKAEHLADWGFTGDYCHHCGIKNSEISGLLMQCGRCKQAYYCSTKCFNEALPVHRQTCDTEAWTRDPKGTKMERTERSQATEDRAPKDYEEPNRIKKDKKKLKDEDRKNKKGDLSFPNRKYEDDSKTPKSSKQSTKNSTSNSLYDDTEFDEVSKNSYSQTKSTVNSEKDKKKDKKKSLANYDDDDDDTEESATVTTEHVDDVEEIADEITEAVMKYRQENPYSNKEYDSDEEDSESEDESNSDDESNFDDDVRKKKNKGKISTSYNDSSDDESEDDENSTKVKSKKSVRYGDVSLDDEFEDEFEVVTNVSVTSNSYVSQDSNEAKFKTDCTPIEDIEEEEDIVTPGNQSQKEEENQQTKIRKEYERGVTVGGIDTPEKSPKWPGGKLLPEKASVEKEEIRLRRLSQQEHKEHKWDRPDWVNPSLRPVSVNGKDGNDSFSADDILAIASDEEKGSENSAHNSLSLRDVNQSSQNYQIDNENEADNEGANRDNKIVDQRHLQTSVGNIRPSHLNSSEREARRSGLGRLAYHKSYIDDIYYSEEQARNLRTGNGVVDSEISEEEAIKLRRVEAQQKKEYNWEQPEWTKSREGRLDRSRSAEEPLYHASGNFEHSTPDFNTSIASLRHVNEKERQRPSWTKPDWAQNKPIGKRRGMAESSSALRFERDDNNSADKDLYQSFSAFNYTPTPPEAILMTKEELRKAETIRNKQYGWRKPDWASKSPLKRSSKLWKPAAELSELSPIEIVASGKVEHKILERSKNNSRPQTVSKESIHVQKSTDMRQTQIAKKELLPSNAKVHSTNTQLHSTNAKQQSNTSDKKYYYEEDNIYSSTTVSIEKEPVILLDSTKKYHYDEDTLYSMG